MVDRTAELLKVPGLAIDRHGVVVVPPSTRDLERYLQGTSLEAIFDERCDQLDFHSARAMVDVGLIDEGRSEALEDQITQERHRLRVRSQRTADRLAVRRDDLTVGEEAALDVEVRLSEAAELEGLGDLLAARVALDTADEILTRAARQAAHRMRLLLEAADPPLDAPTRALIEHAVEREEFGVAQEIIQQAQDAEGHADLPQHEGRRLEQFNATGEILSRAGAVLGALDWVETDWRDEASELLAAWSEFEDIAAQISSGAMTHPDTPIINLLRRLLPQLGLNSAGITSRPPGSRTGRGRLWLQLNGAEPTGHSLVPDFGSAAAGSYRVLVLFNRISARDLSSALDADESSDPVIVLSADGFDATARREVAEKRRKSNTLRPSALVDPATVTWLCATSLAPDERWPGVMLAALPFTVVNPFRPNAQGEVPKEVFFGRSNELKQLLDPHGSSFVYGGRQLGKSALLRKLRRRAMRLGHIAIVIDLNYALAGTEGGGPEIWRFALNGLTDAGVEVPSASARRVDVFDEFEQAVRGWLESNPGRMVYLLLDECDRFLDADRVDAYTQTQRIRGLMLETSRRFKCVLAGLHQVQRFERDSNQPLAHLAQRPVRVGALEPRDAYKLIDRPLHAIGYRWESPELPFRLAAFANYQASILQLLGSRLADNLLSVTRHPGTPPVEVTTTMVNAVLANDELRTEIRQRFEWTLNLDQRYRLLAYLFAIRAHDELGATSASLNEITVVSLADELRSTWPAMFQTYGHDDVLGLLEEMTGLGILRRTPSAGYALRNPNVLSLLGSYEEIADRLTTPREFEVAAPRDPAAERIALDGGAPSPLPRSTLRNLIEHDRTVLVGAPASGLERVPEALELVLEPLGHRLVNVRHPDQIDRGADALNWIHVDSENDLAAAVSLLEHTGVRAIVLAGVTDFVSMEIESEVEIEWLHRWSAADLSSWLGDHPAQFNVERILRTTGGWHEPVIAWLREFETSESADTATAATERGIGDGEWGPSSLGLRPGSPVLAASATLAALDQIDLVELDEWIRFAADESNLSAGQSERFATAIREMFIDTEGVVAIPNRWAAHLLNVAHQRDEESDG
ncbi:MAG: ATP-binding protein [Microthrixaceae bacterium]